MGLRGMSIRSNSHATAYHEWHRLAPPHTCHPRFLISAENKKRRNLPRTRGVKKIKRKKERQFKIEVYGTDENKTKKTFVMNIKIWTGRDLNPRPLAI